MIADWEQRKGSSFTIENVSDSSIWTSPHLLQVKFLDTAFICLTTPQHLVCSSLHNRREN